MRKSLVIFLMLCFGLVGLAQSQKPKSKKTKSQKAKPTTQQTQTKDDDKYSPLPKPKNEITPEEEKEAKAFAESFIERMRETRDLKPLINELFISKFKDLDEFWWATVGLPIKRVDSLNADERLKLYCDKVTIDYQTRLYFYSKLSDSQITNLKDNDEINENLFPPALINYGKTIKIPDEKMSDRELMLLAMKYSENTLNLWREETIKNPPEITEQFRANLEIFSKHLEDKDNNWGKPFASVMDKEKYGLPAGTKIIRLEIPFHIGLVMAKEEGKMKILCIFSRVLPD